MIQKLPPLKALASFEAAARHKSFTRAAEELGVTQGAVSKQVQLLEEALGVKLFTRAAKRVALTREGETLLPSVVSAFDMLRQSADQITRGGGRTELLTINILPSLSSRWLIPLLNDFRRAYPRVGVQVTIGDGPVDFADNNADIAIRSARKNEWRRLHAEPLMDEELLPVCSPALLRLQPLATAADFSRHTLLQHTSRAEMWREYLAAMGVRTQPVRHDLGFEHFFMLIQAAADGLGVALIPRFLIARELAEGTLAIAFAKPYTSPYRYYFVCSRPALELRKVRQFRDWLRRVTRADAARN
jgi:LysR family glycine cleavage system transcriptional activator